MLDRISAKNPDIDNLNKFLAEKNIKDVLDPKFN